MEQLDLRAFHQETENLRADRKRSAAGFAICAPARTRLHQPLRRHILLPGRSCTARSCRTSPREFQAEHRRGRHRDRHARAPPDAKQPFEVQAAEIAVEGPSTPDFPIQPKRHSMEYLRTVSHLRPRTNTFRPYSRVRSVIAYAIHKFFQERDFVYVHTPLITGSDCEGRGRDVPGHDAGSFPTRP